MIKITVVEETKEVILRINGVDVPIDEVDYIEIGAVEPKKDMEKTGFAIYHSIEDISKNIQNNSEKYAVFLKKRS